ncbi:glycoside hydrolase N-terminal domain-containing protein [Arthrobacter sp. ISL-30]|uniref:glycosyl hydrolase family 95 catalytic domain-containing protein n=1 Tax=Arthrobacter sp. ISL-30 TaxID=2819109 RepID=UPI001BE9FA5B|nr:glycoside hydrolase N-terminal domain-containing protein [Arthrobacter sp. ISL-30]MBT2515154.1 glycoside hydrolase N-terminal domain-containing protein [Arthrobacter sp. ISL-30]
MTNSRHTLALASPAATFHDAFLLGNGSLGAAMFGNPGTERAAPNLDTFWSGGPINPNDYAATNPSQWLNPLRQAIRSRNFAEADQLARKLQSQQYTQSYQPLGTLEWNYGPAPSGKDDYLRALNLRRAVATVSYRSSGERIQLESFVSAPDKVAVFALDRPASVGKVLPEATFESPHLTRSHIVSSGRDQNLRLWMGRAPSFVAPNYVHDEPRPVRYADDLPDSAGLVDAGMGFAVAVLSERNSDDGERVLVAAVDGFRGRTSRPSADVEALGEQAVEIVLAAAGKTTHELRESHEADFASYFDRIDLDLSASRSGAPPATLAADGSKERDHADPAAAEVFFDLGRYLLISSSRPGSQPATLQGIWNQDVRPGWSCNYTTNINVQMNYWPAEAAGLSDCAAPLLDFIGDLAELGRQTAKDAYSARGWAVHHNTDLWGFTVPVKGEPVWSNWPMGGLWLAAQLFERFAYGKDRAWARKVLWPVLAGAAEFALDLLEPYDDGLLVTNPSTSPEHMFNAPGGGLFAAAAGSSMDLELVRETLSRVLALHDAGLSPDGGQAASLVAEAREALAALRKPQLGARGELLEFIEDWEPEDRGHRHVSHLYGLFPGESIDELAGPVTYDAARRALQERIANGGGHTGWSQAWILCLAARLRDPELVQESLDILVRKLTSTSLLDLHPMGDHPTGFLFQIDGNFGAAAGIIEALVQSQSGSIRALSALPSAWTAGSLRGVHARGGHIADVSWKDGRLDRLDIHAARDEEIVLCLPEGNVKSSVLRDGQQTPVRPPSATAPEGRQRFRWTAKSGERLIVVPVP